MMDGHTDCRSLRRDVFEQRQLIIVSNRGPISISTGEDGNDVIERSGGGLATALIGLARQLPTTWIACATSAAERAWNANGSANGGGKPLPDLPDLPVQPYFVNPDAEMYEGYYGVIANPLLWFLQHSIWDFSRAPTLNRSTWLAWEQGYRAVNWMFAEAVVDQVRRGQQPSLVMFQDYHLYLAPRFVRSRLRSLRGSALTHFIHIPWPGPEDWGMLPDRMREAILDGLCAVDLLGFQTREDSLNFMRTCESLLPGARVNYLKGRVNYDNHTTYVRDFPISIDVDSVRTTGTSEEARQFHQQLSELVGERRLILRIDRMEPSKNIVRGFQAYEEMLEIYPEHRGKVQFLALQVPSRLEVSEYQDYLNTIMAAAGQVNVRFGTSDWEPVRILVGESYPRALAALQLYDVLLVNPVADGMNLVAKEGPVLNQRDGVLVLSERAGAHQQLGEFSLVVSPCDVSSTAEALNQALTMPAEERHERACALRSKVESEDIRLWLCWQLDALQELMNWNHKPVLAESRR